MGDGADYLDIRDVTRLFWRGRYAIFLSAVSVAIVSAIVAVMQPDVYTSQVLLRPAGDEFDASRNAGALSSLGALAGLSVDRTRSRADYAMALLESRSFLADFARRHQIVPELLATKSWSRESGGIVYDEKMYSSVTGAWRLDDGAGAASEPNETQIYEAFRSILQIQQDGRTGFVRVSITFFSPDLASDWLRLLVSDLNERVRRSSIDELDRSLEYLGAALERTVVTDVRASLGMLLQSQIRDRMLADAKDEYALETIDPAYVPDFKSAPPRVLMVLVGALFGAFLGVLAVLVFQGLRSPDRPVGK